MQTMKPTFVFLLLALAIVLFALSDQIAVALHSREIVWPRPLEWQYSVGESIQ